MGRYLHGCRLSSDRSSEKVVSRESAIDGPESRSADSCADKLGTISASERPCASNDCQSCRPFLRPHRLRRDFCRCARAGDMGEAAPITSSAAGCLQESEPAGAACERARQEALIKKAATKAAGRSRRINDASSRFRARTAREVRGMPCSTPRGPCRRSSAGPALAWAVRTMRR
jgi:hypothetical protein